ncbi:MAG TPA: hypothetical protein VN748_11585 [Pseudonocardiaceae bacterium]|nr:hypothetical protein [Pseudonocardiaceae bacterium]
MTSGQSMGRADPKLGQHHARRLVDLRTAMDLVALMLDAGRIEPGMRVFGDRHR